MGAVALLLIASLIIWYGSGLVLNVASSLAATLRLSPFILSFFVLGILTSLPEIMISATAVSRAEPELMVGNLLGGSLIIFLLIIPLMTLGNGNLRMPTRLTRTDLIYALLTIIAPAIFIFDRRLTSWEGYTLILFYLTLFVLLFRRQHLLDRLHQLFRTHRHHGYRIFKLLLGLLLLYLGSQAVVTAAEQLSAALSLHYFVVGLVLVSLGSNLPELSLVIRSIISGQTNIALADYIGSAAANTLILGLATVVSPQPILLPNHALPRLAILATGLALFYFFARSQRTLSRREGMVLLTLYVGLIVLELNFA